MMVSTLTGAFLTHYEVLIIMAINSLRHIGLYKFPYGNTHCPVGRVPKRFAISCSQLFKGIVLDK